ncbi:ABC transporter permease [Ferviditalea candida]|uniref:ABC transporter permease n=1 Tax=Ferviditalea candida TaxID=3108399 RepID=A0ABU5ZLY4_9BACL|nr:ABC transporter permease [Paenibacillaceae bacterium T2]
MNLVRRLRNPVLFKELRMRMRSKRSPWAISLYLLVLGGIALAFIYLQTGLDSYFNPNRSREIFMMLSLFQLAMVAFVTPGLTAGVISGERERQTLNILQTTNLSATKLILGKWLASLSFMIFLVLASIPLYSIVFLFGGISPVQLLQVFSFYLVTMLSCGAAGVFFSTVFKRTGVSTVVTYAVIFGYTAGSGIFATLATSFFMRGLYQSGGGIPNPGVPFWSHFLHSVNPLFAMLDIFDQGPLRSMYGVSGQHAPQIDSYWLFSLFFGSLTVILLLWSIYLVRPVKPRLFRK